MNVVVLKRQRLKAPLLFSLGALAFALTLEASYRSYWYWKTPLRGSARVFEIYVVGESTAVGSPYGRLSFALLAGKFLGGQADGLPIVVKNWAMGGESIYPQALAMRNKFRYRDRRNPAAVFIYSGHNETMSRPQEWTGLAYVGRWIREHLLYRSWVVSDCVMAAERRRLIGGIRDLEHYEFYMRKVLEESLAGGAVPIVSTVIGNLVVEPTLQMSEGIGADQGRELLAKGLVLEASRPADALKYYEDALPDHPELAPALYYRMGKCREAQRDYGAARELYWKAVDAELMGRRAKTRQNELLRRLGRDYQIPIVDAVKLYEEQSPHGIPDNGLFIDFQHPNMKGYLILGRAFAQALGSRFKAALAVDRITPEEAYRSVAYQPLDLYQINVMSGHSMLAHSLRYLLIQDRLELARNDFQEALRFKPDGFSGWLGLAFVEAAERHDTLRRESEIQWMQDHFPSVGNEFCVPEADIPGLVAWLKKNSVSEATLDRVKRYSRQAFESDYCRRRLPR